MSSVYNDFLRALRFTIAHECNKLAIAEDLVDQQGRPQVVELDDTVNAARLLSGSESCLVWRLVTNDEDPADPLYLTTFTVGVKTTNDAANYNMLGFLSSVTEVFPVGDTLMVQDWSADVAPTADLGSLYFTSSGVDQQLKDAASGIRLVGVEARTVRFK